MRFPNYTTSHGSPTLRQPFTGLEHGKTQAFAQNHIQAQPNTQTFSGDGSAPKLARKVTSRAKVTQGSLSLLHVSGSARETNASGLHVPRRLSHASEVLTAATCVRNPVLALQVVDPAAPDVRHRSLVACQQGCLATSPHSPQHATLPNKKPVKKTIVIIDINASATLTMPVTL